MPSVFRCLVSASYS